MTVWNEIADDHYVSLYWSGGLNIDNDGYPLTPPSNVPETSGMDVYIAHQVLIPANQYRCKFCRSLIAFVNRKPYNLLDGSKHRCLTCKAEAVPAK